MKMPGPYMTASKVVARIGVSAALLRKLARKGHLHPAKFGPPQLDKFGRDRRLSLYPVAELNALIDGTMIF